MKNTEKSKVILNEKSAINSSYRVSLYVIEVPCGKKFPQGVKAKFTLIDITKNAPRLLIDNHEPFGFHMHTKLPENHEIRILLDVMDHNEALVIFYREIERILKNEQK